MKIRCRRLSFLGCPNYKVGEDGSVWRFWSLKGWKRRPPRPDPETGYVRVTLSENNETKRFYVHQLVLLSFAGPCPLGMECRHLDGDPTNNHRDNLCWGTPKQNGEDKVRHGRSPKGRKNYWYGVRCPGTENHNAIIDDKKVRKMRRLYSRYNRRGGWTLKRLALRFNVSISTVSKIVRREAWTHVS